MREPTLEDLAAVVPAALGQFFSGRPYTRGRFARVFLKWQRIEIGEAVLVDGAVSLITYPRGEEIMPHGAAEKLTAALAARVESE